MIFLLSFSGVLQITIILHSLWHIEIWYWLMIIVLSYVIRYLVCLACGLSVYWCHVPRWVPLPQWYPPPGVVAEWVREMLIPPLSCGQHWTWFHANFLIAGGRNWSCEIKWQDGDQFPGVHAVALIREMWSLGCMSISCNTGFHWRELSFNFTWKWHMSQPFHWHAAHMHETTCRSNAWTCLHLD